MIMSSGRELADSGGGVGREGGRKRVGEARRAERNEDALESGGVREKVMRRSRSSGESAKVWKRDQQGLRLVSITLAHLQ